MRTTTDLQADDVVMYKALMQLLAAQASADSLLLRSSANNSTTKISSIANVMYDCTSYRRMVIHTR